MEKLNFTELQLKFAPILEKFEDANSLKKEYDGLTHSSDIDKKTAIEQTFRELVLRKFIHDVPTIKKLIKFAIESSKKELTSISIPVVLLGDVFDVVTLDKCEELFQFVEENVSAFKEDQFFTPCKNHLLRICNDLLRRLSRSQNTVFCGRILLFLAKFFPFSERSGLNIVSEFNVDNVTEYGSESNELAETMGDSEDLKVDYNLYCKFWALQEFFRCPYICYDKANWKKFTTHTSAVLSAFSSFKLEEHKSKSSKVEDDGMGESIDLNKIEVEESHHFFAKFLTNPKLLALQLSDSNFRRSVLVQFLILFHYLNSTVKFKGDTDNLSVIQTEWLNDTELLIYKLVVETPPNGKKFAEAVKHMLKREELWNNWKNDGCKEITRPDPNYKPSAPKRPRRLLGDLISESNKQGKFYMGTPELTRLWNLCPDNLQACKGTDRNFLPSLESYLENPKEKTDPSFEWRALRLLARQSPHFFTLLNTPSCKITDYLECVHKKIQKDKLETKVETEEAIADPLDNEVFDDALDDAEQLTPEEKDSHKPATASTEQIAEISKAIGSDWKKLGTKLGYTNDVIDFCESEASAVDEQCLKMLTIWFGEDDDANLDNLAYILEGLQIMKAAEVAKTMIIVTVPDEISE